MEALPKTHKEFNVSYTRMDWIKILQWDEGCDFTFKESPNMKWVLVQLRLLLAAAQWLS